MVFYTLLNCIGKHWLVGQWSKGQICAPKITKENPSLNSITYKQGFWIWKAKEARGIQELGSLLFITITLFFASSGRPKGGWKE